MIITKDLNKYIIHKYASVRDALSKIKTERTRIIFAVDEANRVEGLLTMGDILRWILSRDSVDLNLPVNAIVNRNFHYVQSGSESMKLPKLLSVKRIHTVPVVDKKMTLTAIATTEIIGITIGGYLIDESSPAFIIAEIGNNHNGSVELARELVDASIDAGANCVKFQMRNMQFLYSNYGNGSDPSADLGTQYTLDLLAKQQLSNQDMFTLFDYCREQGVEPLCTPWDKPSAEALEDYGVNAYKIASADLTNHDLIKFVASTRKPMICSTGMSTEREIIDTVRLLKDEAAQFILLHCNSTYPAPFKDVNLRYINRLVEIGNCPVGYSGHERGYYIPVAAVAMGAKVIEKHITISREMEGNDHKVSLLPHEFKEMVLAIRNVEEAVSTPVHLGRELSQGEMINRETLGKSLIAKTDIQKGVIITEEMIDVKSPGKGLPPYRKLGLIGLKTKRAFKKNDFFYNSDIEEQSSKVRKYQIPQPWGIPARFHDWKQLSALSNMQIVEFHLSYKDLELSLDSYFFQESDLGFLVHCPELFEGDHILDLCATDPEYRCRSIQLFKKVAEKTLEIGKFFPKTNRPRIITNIGGFSAHNFLNEKERKTLFNNFSNSLGELRCDSYEIIPQTMPPFPWHFGGQRHHNILVSAENIEMICERESLSICLDVSHSQLACNYYNWSMGEFLTRTAPHTSHFHLSDAEGTDGEGLQIGEGDIDFFQLMRIISAKAPNASFIPEIWQGHKNEGEGFWIALERLEHYFKLKGL